MDSEKQAHDERIKALLEERVQRAKQCAERLLQGNLGWSSVESKDFVENLYNKIPVLSWSFKMKLYVEGIVRWYCEGKIDLTNQQDLFRVNQMMKVLSRSIERDDLRCNFYSEIHNRLLSFAEVVQFLDIDVDDTPTLGTSEHTFEVVEIETSQELNRYYDLIKRWCIAQYEDVFDEYITNGLNKLYLVLRDDYKEVKASPGDNPPYDDYGFSIMAVIVSPDSGIISITSRWNFEDSDLFVTPDALKELIGADSFNKISLNHTTLNSQDGEPTPRRQNY